MINRDTPNKDLLVVTHGLYQDYELMKQHTYRKILNYLEEHFPIDKECSFWSGHYVDIHSFEYNPRSMSDFEIILSAETTLNEEEVEDFCEEFSLEFVKFGTETKAISFIPYKIKNVAKGTKFFYYFKRDRRGE